MLIWIITCSSCPQVVVVYGAAPETIAWTHSGPSTHTEARQNNPPRFKNLNLCYRSLKYTAGREGNEFIDLVDTAMCFCQLFYWVKMSGRLVIAHAIHTRPMFVYASLNVGSGVCGWLCVMRGGTWSWWICLSWMVHGSCATGHRSSVAMPSGLITRWAVWLVCSKSW